MSGLLKKLGRVAACVFLTVLFSFGVTKAQNFVNNDAATYTATCGAVIKMKSSTGAIQTNGGNELGANAANVIQGVVDWAADDNGQEVQGLFYSSLVISGTGTKTVLDGVNVTGGACLTFLTGYDDLGIYPFIILGGSGDNTFEGEFTYSSDDPQTIFPIYNVDDPQPNNYNNLVLSGTGLKTINDGDDIGIAGQLTLDAATDLVVSGGLYLGDQPSDLAGDVTIDGANASINVGEGDLAFSGTLDIDNGGDLNGGDGDITFNADVTVTNGGINISDGDGSVTISVDATLNLVGDDSTLDFGDNTNLFVTGDLINGGDGTNVNFNCGSTVTFNGTQAPQIIMPTLTTNSYGNLVLLNGEKQGGDAANYANDLFSCGDFTLSGGNLDMFENGGALSLTDVAAVVTYGDGTGNEEVEGLMSRTTDGDARSYTLNNRETVLTLAADANNPTSFTMNVRPGQEPEQYDADTDVRRLITPEYAGNGVAFDFTLRVGYLENERTDNWDAPNGHETIRFYESNAGGIEKVAATGFAYDRQAAAGAVLGFVELEGIGSTNDVLLPNNTNLFASGNDLVLRTGPTTFISVADGRWTNPNTWDEAIQPTQNDLVEIRTVVYAGIDGPFAGTPGGADDTAENNTLDELEHYQGNNPVARSITVVTPQAPSTASALIVGNEDNGAGFVFRTALNTATSLTNSNTTAPTVAFPMPAKNEINTSAGLQGIWVNGYGPETAILGTYQLENEGSLNNEGVIEIGE